MSKENTPTVFGRKIKQPKTIVTVKERGKEVQKFVVLSEQEEVAAVLARALSESFDE